MARKQPFNINDLASVQIGLASPDMIREWSNGEILKPETVNYRSQKPELMVFSVNESSDLVRIMNVIVVNIDGFATAVQFVKSVVLKYF